MIRKTLIPMSSSSSPKDIFEIHHQHKHSKARLGTVTLARGKVQTPVFMPIGTCGSVKSASNLELQKIGFEIILGNTYHLWLKPGTEVLQQSKWASEIKNELIKTNREAGLHSFQNWQRPILTDSGGFQAWSLSKIRKFTEEGVKFKVPKTGETRFLSPEISMQIQTILGSDIALVLDECLDAGVSEREARRAMHRTRRWAERSKLEFERLRGGEYTLNKQVGKNEILSSVSSDTSDDISHQNVLFGIPQGAQFPNLRKESAELTMELDFAGYSIGGVANGGEPEEVMYDQVLSQTEILENYKPRHLLGVGTPKDIIEMVKRGIDMFDCVYPTRNARHGTIFLWQDKQRLEYESVKIAGKRYETDFEPINPNSIFEELRNYSKAYLRHLFRAQELLAMRLATLNNLEFYFELMQILREKIQNDEKF
jgi:queuine tRNA-ribosyltransferase